MLKIVLLIIAVALVYWLYRTHIRGGKKETQDTRPQSILQTELSNLKNQIPPGYYMSVLAMSKSRMSPEEVVESLDELIAKMKENDVDPQPVEKLVLKIEQDMETQ